MNRRLHEMANWSKGTSYWAFQHSPATIAPNIAAEVQETGNATAEVHDIGNVTPEVHPILLHGRARRGVSPNHQYWLETRSGLTAAWVNDRPAFEAMRPLTPVENPGLWSPNMPPKECKRPRFHPSLDLTFFQSCDCPQDKRKLAH